MLPQTETDVDLSGDLSWIGGVKKKALWNRPLVWALGMLYMGGLHWKEIARRTGMKEGSLRSLRTRSGIPVDHNRAKQTRTFDEEVAHVTWRASGYLVKQCQRTGQFFWEHKSRRGCNTSPMARRKDGFRDTMAAKLLVRPIGAPAMNLELPEGTTVQIFIGRPVPAAHNADGAAIGLPGPHRARPLLKGAGVIVLIGVAFYLGQHSVVRHADVDVAEAADATTLLPALPRPLAVPDRPPPHVAQADPNPMPPEFQRQLQQAPSVVPPPGARVQPQAGAHPFGLEN